MRYLILTLILTITLCSFGQSGKVKYLDPDTIKGLDTVYMSLPKITGFYSVSWELYFEQLGGTSDGIGILEASNDTLFSTVNSIDGLVEVMPNDTITISDGLKVTCWLYGTPSINYRYRLIGTLGDTTSIISNYVYKR